jgi:hypothetical protein
MAVQVLAALTRIGDCLMGVSPTYGEAWNGRMRCTTGMAGYRITPVLVFWTGRAVYWVNSPAHASISLAMRQIEIEIF